MADGRLDALNGGPAPIPQADTMRIAKQLLGPQLAERYGDVIGARPTGIADIARDFAIGTISGDMFKADQLKSQVVQQYQESYQREEQAGRQRDAENRQKVDALFRGLDQVRRVPKEFRKDLLQHVLQSTVGSEAHPLVAKILSDPDKFESVNELTSEDMQRLADDDPQAFLDNATQVIGDPRQAIEFLGGLQRLKQQRVQTQNSILDANRRAQTAVTATDRARNQFLARMAGKTRKDRLGRDVPIPPQEIMDLADQFFPSGGAVGPAAAEPVGIPQEPPAAIAGTSSTTTTPTTTGAEPSASAQAALGIPQAAPAAPAAGKVKRPQITGTVTQIE
jgi:hypothetical protein